MGIVTISRLLGAGETAVAPLLASRLGWEVADLSILNRESEITGLSIQSAMRWDEHDPSILERLHGQGAEFAAFLHSSRLAMRELAAKGNVVIIGRGGNILLRGQPDAVHVRLIADMPYRVRRVMEVRWLSEEPALQVIAKNDANAQLFYRNVFRADPNDPLLYDIVLRTDTLGIPRIVDILAEYFEKSIVPKETPHG